MDLESFLVERIDNRIKSMHCGLAACDDHDFTAACCRRRCQVGYGKLGVSIECPAFLCIAPGASYVASGQADEVSCRPREGAFTLNCVKMVDDGIDGLGSHGCVLSSRHDGY
jgi:hypothetical protein